MSQPALKVVQRREKFIRDVDTNLFKVMEAYRILLKRSHIGSSISIHEDLHVDTAATNIVSNVTL